MQNIFDDRSAAPEAAVGSEKLARQEAIKQIERRRRFWTRVTWSAIAMAVLVIIWAVSEYHNAGGLPTSGFSNSSSIHHVWNYWIIYPLVIWVALLAAGGYAVYRRKPITESEIQREMGR